MTYLVLASIAALVIILSFVGYHWKKCSLGENTGNLAQIASALIAAIGFAAVVYQIQMSRDKSTREALRAEVSEARKVYMSYSESLLKYPELSVPDYEALMRNHREYLRYKNFVAHMIWAYDEILAAVTEEGSREDKEAWLTAFKIDTGTHQRYLCNLERTEPEFFEMYGSDMRARLRQKDAVGCKHALPLEERGQSIELGGPG